MLKNSQDPDSRVGVTGNSSFIHPTGSVATFRSDNSSTTSSSGSSNFSPSIAIRPSRRHSLKPTYDYTPSSASSDAFSNVGNQYTSDPFSVSNLKAHLEHVDMAGYLNVRRKQLVSKNWKRRWFMLKDQQLICHLNGPGSEVCGVFSLTNYLRISHEPECRQSTLCMVLYSDQPDIEPLYLYANSPTEYQGWFFSIDKCLREKSVNIIDRVMERLNSTKGTTMTDFYIERNSISIDTNSIANRYSHDFRLDPAPTGKKQRSGSISAWSNSSSTIFNTLSMFSPGGRVSSQFNPCERDEFDLDNESICSKASFKQKLSGFLAS
ncbi:hypothetical protein CONCODRAFT_8341 [Conidiobolus coronatus NRRL 28638]|uniref:PH domain-containing protein n=1 Tax=Conidiobolus coronatus (strain ATCC 28846 / CBS 209.66 / NRRL 28638) TaxID=796925 RepID=A0A137P2L5_CONC2|nr:hypothetical protein CONCODRAFT_8341 [Conidiobolus coronatus NRRL 28638]|eukprot:KXN69276.1 hypothetical protein CONCODRAFT_8341 [Conidiobolus coronatus NRRL 28638]